MEKNFLLKNIEIPCLTGLRFFAALFVCISHTLHRTPLNNHSFWCLLGSRLSAIGMTLFFVLSGFVIHYNYSRPILKNIKQGLYHFLVARFARLWPLYFVCLTIDIIRQTYKFSSLPSLFFESIPFYLTLTQSWIYLPIGDKALIYQFGQMASISWSISTEWFFYLCYPLICFAVFKQKMLSSKIFTMITISLYTITGIAIISINKSEINAHAINLFGNVADAFINQQNSFFRWLIYFSPYSRISEFIMGCFIAGIYMQLSQPPSKREERFGLIVLITSILGLASSYWIIFHAPQTAWSNWLPDLHQCFGFAPALAVMIFCCARYQNLISRFLSLRFILFGGEISYSMYLLHPISLSICFPLAVKISSYSLIQLLIILGATYCLAAISYRLIETPARAFIRKKLITSKLPSPIPAY